MSNDEREQPQLVYIEKIKQFSFENKASFSEVVDLYFCSASDCMKVIEKKCNVRSVETWKNAVSELLIISDNIDARVVSKICRNILNNQELSLQDMQNYCSALYNAIEDVRSYLRNYNS